MSRIPAILDAINSGHEVIISTHLHATRVNKKTLDRFTNAGHDLFLHSKGSDYMASGKRFVCIDYCRISIGLWTIH